MYLLYAECWGLIFHPIESIFSPISTLYCSFMKAYIHEDSALVFAPQGCFYIVCFVLVLSCRMLTCAASARRPMENNGKNSSTLLIAPSPPNFLPGQA